ncbi:MAG: HEAT repeat domain-containing protein [Blastocatellia bacterium]|nr:HEAT repeat domain-containing protein [Blastocatellia bacterium]
MKYRKEDPNLKKEDAGTMKNQLVARPQKNTSSKEEISARQEVTEEAQRFIEESQDHNNVAAGQGADEECWRQDMDTLRRAAANLARRRTNVEGPVPGTSAPDSFHRIAKSLDDSSSEARSAIVRVLYDLDPDRAASFFNLALRESSLEDRRLLGAALAGSGLVNKAIQDLMGDSYENSYGAFSLLFLVAKAGEFQSLMQVIENHPSIELRVAVIRLLGSSGEPEVAPTFSRLAMSRSVPAEVRSAAMEAINQIDGQSKKRQNQPRESNHLEVIDNNC